MSKLATIHIFPLDGKKKPVKTPLSLRKIAFSNSRQERHLFVFLSLGPICIRAYGAIRPISTGQTRQNSRFWPSLPSLYHLILEMNSPTRYAIMSLLPLASAGKESYLPRKNGLVNSPLIFFLKFVQELSHNSTVPSKNYPGRW